MKNKTTHAFAKTAGVRPSVIDNVEREQPAISRAVQLLDRTTNAGWVWPDEAALRRNAAGELAELEAECAAPAPDRERIESGLGDVLFTLIDLAHYKGIDPGRALHAMMDRWEGRFHHMDAALYAQGQDFTSTTFHEHLALRKEAKKREKEDHDAAKPDRPPTRHAEAPARKP